MMLALLALANTAVAHNWLSSPARAGDVPFAAFNGHASPPCPARGTRVHMQVGPGQKFPIEWASGHGYGTSTYLIVLRASDENQMRLHTFELLDDYLAKAPNQNYMKSGSDQDWVYHVTEDGPTTEASIGAEVNIATVRPIQFRQRVGKSPRMYKKTVAASANYKRAQYNSADYPWIIAVHKFPLHEDKPEEADFAYVEIPTGFPSGQYIVQYVWNGYYDCVDVNLLTVASTDLFGNITAGPPTFDRTDHCLYTPSLQDYQANKGCFAIQDGETIETCVNACLGQYSCSGLQVVPARLPATAKYPGVFNNGQRHYPDSCTTVATANPDALLCFPLDIGKSPQVGPPLKTAWDPEDPVFYSTCYQRKSPYSFKQTCTACSPPDVLPTYRVNDKCMDCWTMITGAIPHAVPKWKFSDNCIDCTLG